MIIEVGYWSVHAETEIHAATKIVDKKLIPFTVFAIVAMFLIALNGFTAITMLGF